MPDPMPELSPVQYQLVYNAMSFAVATFLAGFLFFIRSHDQLAPRYRSVLVLSTLITAIAGYHYLRIFQSWEGAYAAAGDVYAPTGEPFNDAYRYMDWLLTVPLLLAELVAVMRLRLDLSRSLLWKLVIAAALMIVLGYPGELSNDLGAQWLWFVLSCIPFVYILIVLVTTLGKEIGAMQGEVRSRMQSARSLLIVSWFFYPLAYLVMMYDVFGPANTEVVVQIGYTVADLTAKVLYGVLIYRVARAASEQEGWRPLDAGTGPHPTA